MYNPSAFLISAAALTSIFSFFFGGYYQERDKTYALWLKIVAYGANSSTEDETRTICSKVESRERLSEIWRALGCRELKLPEHERQRIPEKFYQDLENAGEVEPPPET